MTTVTLVVTEEAAVTATAAAPGVFTTDGHSITDNDLLLAVGFDEMTELNGNFFASRDVDGTDLNLAGTGPNSGLIDTSGFTAETTGGSLLPCATPVLDVERAGENLTFSITGTWVGTVAFQREVSPHSNVWVTIAQYTANVSRIWKQDRQDERYRAVMIAWTSGAPTMTISDAVKVLHTYTDELGRAIFVVTEDGISIPGTLDVTGALTAGSFTGDITGDVTGDVTGNLAGNVTGDVAGNVTGIGNFTAILGTDASLGIDGLAAAQGGAVAIKGGTSSTAGNVGGVAGITGGAGGATSAGGAASLVGGTAGATSGAGGAANVTSGAGSATVAGGESGTVTLASGVTTGGTSETASATGAVALNSGAPGVATTGTGGASGSASLTTAAGGAASGAGGAGGAAGNALITGGAGGADGEGGSGTGGAGGSVIVTSGAGGAGNTAGVAGSIFNRKDSASAPTGLSMESQAIPQGDASGAADLVFGDIFSGVYVNTPGAAVTVDWPGGQLMANAIPDIAVGDSFTCSIINLSTTTGRTITMADQGLTGTVSMVGSAVIQPAVIAEGTGSSLWRLRYFGANAWTAYRIG